jgi:hypothetical protein
MTAQGKPATYPRVAVRRTTYRRVEGFTVTLYTAPGRSKHHQPSLFVESRRATLRCKARFLAGERITAGDLAA